MFFANGVQQASNILVMNQNMVKKIYFPRLTMPVASVFSGVVDFALAFIVLLGMMVVYRIYPTANIIWLPLLLLLALVTCLGVSFWSSAMNAQFRDIRYAIPFIIQVWFFLTPIVYSSSMLPEPWRTLYGINPMAGVVEGFRWALLGTDTQPGSIVLLSAVVAVILFISGAYYFRRMERTFADIV
jgi:lipopolysaccharide transport system permease protein